MTPTEQILDARLAGQLDASDFKAIDDALYLKLHTIEISKDGVFLVAGKRKFQIPITLSNDDPQKVLEQGGKIFLNAYNALVKVDIQL